MLPVARPRGFLLFLQDIPVSNHESNTNNARTTMEKTKILLLHQPHSQF